MKTVKLFLSVVCFFLISNTYIAQSTTYFQQEVNYTISVTLNDKSHELSAFESIQYINNSNTSLDIIYFHLWPNAYKNQNTALAKQLLENGETTMYYAKTEDLGYIDSLDFTVNGEKIKWEYDTEHIDICKLYLNTPLRSNDTITITTPFHVKIPSATISRLGHDKQAYYITQWYPKPAVFDNKGWHPMPYLTQGEFYSEFGSFNVSITLPKNYVLAATGDRINATEEENWLNGKVQETEKLITENTIPSNNDIPPSSSESKTITFQQFRVHDFAWFADKRFHVLKGEITLPRTEHKVNTWAYFTNNEFKLWAKSIEYLNDATAFYSITNGDYPYNHVSAIDGIISAGGGMEYPNITVIGQSGSAFSLETTIMHEVGHNWFYGMLGSNEREHPWLDEGLNSFNELSYIRAKYPSMRLSNFISADTTFRFFGLNNYKHKSQYELMYDLAARKNIDQPIELPSEYYTNYNYGGIVYSKTAIAFDYLMSYVGQDRFNEAMQFYFENWKFKHPSPENLQKTLEYHFETDLSWFFDDLLKTTKKLDYKVLKHAQLENGSHVVLVKNTGDIKGPLALCGLKNGKIKGIVWRNGIDDKAIIEFPPADIDEFKIDYFTTMPEINRKNNTIRTKGLFKKIEPIKLQFLGQLENSSQTQLFYAPIVGYNHYNKLMIGTALYNNTIFQKKFEYTIMPMFAFGSKTITGLADIKYNYLPKKGIQQLTIGVNGKTFAKSFMDVALFNSINQIQTKPYYLNYYKIEPYINIELKKKNARSPITQNIRYRSVNLFNDNLTYQYIDSLSPLFPSKINQHNYINELSYNLKNKRTINPYNIHLGFQHNDSFGKLSSTIDYFISFKNNKKMHFRVFAGAFVYGTSSAKGPYRFRMSGYNGYQDYLYDNTYVGRSESNGIGFAQFTETEGAFKVWTPLGQSSKWLVALNIKTPKLFKLPLKLFLDLGTSEYNESLLTNKILYNGGLNICIMEDVCDIYIPLFYSEDIKKTLEVNKKSFFDTIRFTFNLQNLNPRKYIADAIQ